MFHKKEAPSRTSLAPNGSRPASGLETVIADGVRLEGDLKTPSSVELCGTVEGEVEVGGRLVVRESGRVLGDVTAREVLVEGVVEGSVTAAGRLELGASGHIQGDLRAGTVSIADGAFLVGKVEMTGASESSPTKDVRLAQPAAV